jgi:protoporphyrinogen oxidase
MRKKKIIVGGGITGLFTAILLLKKYEGEEIILVEKGQIGGLLKSFHYDHFGYFDVGTHIPAETGERVVDEILEPFYSGDNWQCFQGQTRDLAGVYFENHLNQNSISPDINFIDSQDIKLILADLFSLVSQRTKPDFGGNLETLLLGKYGETFTNKYLRPIFYNLYKMSMEKLTPFSINFLPVNRLHYFDQFGYNRLSHDKILRDIFAFPDQENIPESLISGLKSYYPKNIGIYVFIESIKKYLVKHNVRIIENTSVSVVDKESSSIELLNIGELTINVDQVYWTAGLIPLANFIGQKVDYSSMDRPRTTIIVNLVFNQRLNSDKNYYQYNLDPSSDFYRVTLYQNFTKDNPGYFKASIELISDTDNITSEQEIISTVLEDLKKMKLIGGSHVLLFSAVEILSNGFPRPSCKNEVVYDRIRYESQGHYNNLFNLGLNSKEGLFFYRDILKDVYHRIIG